MSLLARIESGSTTTKDAKLLEQLLLASAQLLLNAGRELGEGRGKPFQDVADILRVVGLRQDKAPPQ